MAFQINKIDDLIKYNKDKNYYYHEYYEDYHFKTKEECIESIEELENRLLRNDYNYYDNYKDVRFKTKLEGEEWIMNDIIQTREEEKRNRKVYIVNHYEKYEYNDCIGVAKNLEAATQIISEYEKNEYGDDKNIDDFGNIGKIKTSKKFDGWKVFTTYDGLCTGEYHVIKMTVKE